MMTEFVYLIFPSSFCISYFAFFFLTLLSCLVVCFDICLCACVCVFFFNQGHGIVEILKMLLAE